MGQRNDEFGSRNAEVGNKRMGLGAWGKGHGAGGEKEQASVVAGNRLIDIPEISIALYGIV